MTVLMNAAGFAVSCLVLQILSNVAELYGAEGKVSFQKSLPSYLKDLNTILIPLKIIKVPCEQLHLETIFF